MKHVVVYVIALSDLPCKIAIDGRQSDRQCGWRPSGNRSRGVIKDVPKHPMRAPCSTRSRDLAVNLQLLRTYKAALGIDYPSAMTCAADPAAEHPEHRIGRKEGAVV